MPWVKLPPWHESRSAACLGGYGGSDHDACDGACPEKGCTEHSACGCTCHPALTADERFKLRKMLEALR